MTQDEKFIKLALREAKRNNATFYSCLIVKNDRVIAKACNDQRITNNPTHHAEVNAIGQACQKLKTRYLNDCILYSTGEPCPMCFAAAWWAKIPKIFYGLPLKDLTNRYNRQMQVSCHYLNQHSGKKIKIKGNICRDECLELFKLLSKKS